MFKKIRKLKIKLASVALISLIITACAEGPNSKQNAGTVIGGVAGGLLGSRFGGGEGRIVAAVAGTMLGGYLGNQIGQSLDKADLVYYEKTTRNSLEYNPTGVTSTWRNPDSGNYGRVTPKSTYISQGRNCREFTQEVFIGGVKRQAFGKACRRDDGSWEIVA